MLSITRSSMVKESSYTRHTPKNSETLSSPQRLIFSIESLDKAHDNRKNFNLLDELNAEPAIGIRNNVSTRSRGRHLRTEELLLMKKPGYQGWKQLRMQG
jgi:hypothetical protein